MATTATTATALDWNNTGTDAAKTLSAGGRVLAVSDGVEGYTAKLPGAMTAQHGLDDFAAGYEADAGASVVVAWILWEDGQQIDSGAWEFKAR